jgi:hypothetical protein
MPANRRTTCTQNGITKSQPGVSVSVGSGYLPDGKVILSVTRSYQIKNSFGGIGVSKKLDCYGKVFDNSDAAWAFAFEHGYTMIYYKRK